MLTQGSVEAPVISADLDGGVNEYFHDENNNDYKKDIKDDKNDHEKDELVDVKYGDIELKPMLFQDDILHNNKTIEAAQAANDKMVEVMESKLLDLHRDKSCFLVAGNKTAVKKMKKKLENKPLKFRTTDTSDAYYLPLSVHQSLLQ